MTRTPVAHTRMSAGSARGMPCRQRCFVNRLENPASHVSCQVSWKKLRQASSASNLSRSVKPCRKRAVFRKPREA